ncbi:TIGR00341 family protein [Pontibacter sp. SGAir0037]|uniref:TIGR00341 family protein n=1 Tax=Pontibacter sp. SGAir0037 TaxID=2571030 RepID=UPI0010CD3335|nr:TIGR00341 family protein [Pontibacter sp. SGAir0037]QCR22201.1 TIGR00341 family protein [Pontibacter sp. SGAir0037]
MPLNAIKNSIDKILDILPQTDEAGTIREINDKIPVRGNNTWMLICSAILASIGLDTGSGAVIIGAMLVSPLMSPILGVGLAVGINDREMMIDSLKNLSIAAIAGLFFSTLYFKITPLGEPTNELLARTTPTLLDVMVAFFGGVAGIISISRSDKSNAIPGVAIATALMPPLCTAGYGLALGRFDFFFGGFYLFFINAVFISLATFLIVKYLKFHTKTYINKETERRVARIMAVALFIVVSPSIYFLYNIYQGVQTRKKIENLIISDYTNRENEIIKWEVAQTDSINTIKIYSVGNKVDESVASHYNQVLEENDLPSYKVKLIQLDISPDEVREMASEVTNNITKDFLKTVEIQKMQQSRLDSLRRQSTVYTTANATSDLKLLYPNVTKLQIGEMLITNQQSKQDTVMVVMIDWEKPGRNTQNRAGRADAARIRENEQQIRRFLAAKLKKDSVQVVSSF